MEARVTRVCVAGATGWAGSAVARAILSSQDLQLVSAVARSAAGRDLGVAWEASQEVGVAVVAEVADALEDVDVLVDYTAPQQAKAHALAAINRGVHVVMGTSGLSAQDYGEIESQALKAGVGVVAAGNFALTAALLQATALLAARFLPHREVVDYASDGKPDAPSGTARELAEKLGAVPAAPLTVSLADTIGYPEARGADVSGTRVHSVRLPGYVLAAEVVFGLPNERLTIRHDAGPSAEPYVAGTLLAVRAVPSIAGLVRGLDTLLLTGL